MKNQFAKYRAKRDFLSVTKGMEFPTNEHGEICFNIKWHNGIHVDVYVDPEQYPDDFELVEEPKYTDSDLDWVVKRADVLFNTFDNGQTQHEDVRQAIAELKASKGEK